MTDSRPSWDEVWLDVAEVVARRSLCDRDRVGAVIVDPRQRIVATGYNNPAAGFPHHGLPCTRWCLRPGRASRPGVALATDYSDCPALHSEANALSVCDRSLREGGTIYITSHVCFPCAKLVANSGLARVVVRAGDVGLDRVPDRSYQHLRDCGLAVVEYVGVDATGRNLVAATY